MTFLDREFVRIEQVGDDVVVVAGVEGDVIAAAFGYGADDGECAVAVERGDFDRAGVWDFAEAAPEIVR